MLCELMRHVSCHEVDVFVMWRNVCDVAVEACSSLCSIGTIASRLEAIASKGLRVQFASLSPCSANCPPMQSNCSTLRTTTLKKVQREDYFAVGCIFGAISANSAALSLSSACVQEGRITVDGVDISKIGLRDLREKAL